MFDLATLTPELLEHASGAELVQVEGFLRRELSLLSPLSLAVDVSKAQMHPHQVLLDAWLVALDEGRLYFDGPGPKPVKKDGRRVHPERGDSPVYNLQILMPPRHGKSFMVSQHLPFWVLARDPGRRVALATYSADFSAWWGGELRKLILNNPEVGVTLKGGDQGASSLLRVDGASGLVFCVGVGGGLTGRGFHWLLADDLVKDAKEALSEAIRDNTDNWFRSTLYTRRDKWPDGTPARVVQIGTPWHEDDISGRNVPDEPKAGDLWARLRLPAVFEPEGDEADPIGRAPGEALSPDQVPLEELENLRRTQGEMWFEAMYQCRPSLAEGNIIKRPFNYYTASDGRVAYSLANGETFAHDLDGMYRFATVDLAASLRDHADWTVMAVWAVTPTQPRRILLERVYRVRLETEQHEERIVEWAQESGVRAVHVENKTFGTNLIGRLKRRPEVVVQPLSADHDVLERVLPLASEIRNEKIWFPENAAWLKDFEAELTGFPNAKWDDQVDAAAYAVTVLTRLPRHLDPKRGPRTLSEEAMEQYRQMTRERSRRDIVPVIGRW